MYLETWTDRRREPVEQSVQNRILAIKVPHFTSSPPSLEKATIDEILELKKTLATDRVVLVEGKRMTNWLVGL